MFCFPIWLLPALCVPLCGLAGSSACKSHANEGLSAVRSFLIELKGTHYSLLVPLPFWNSSCIEKLIGLIYSLILHRKLNYTILTLQKLHYGACVSHVLLKGGQRCFLIELI